MPPRSISEMTADSCVFLTGVTGFVGGCLLERICKLEPGPARVYVLVRRKLGVEPQSRLEKMFSSPLFSGIPASKLQRVQAMEGDVGSNEPDLGLSPKDVQILVDNCTHVYHSAAFISFAAQLEQAIRINLRGSRAVLHLARRMKKIRAMVHVSSAYVNCTIGTENSEFEERVYPVEYDVDPVDVLNAVTTMSLQEVEKEYGELIRRHPNTYAFSKHLTENLLARERGHVPLSIVRPSVILNSWREPFVGWVDNVNSGACGYIAGVAKGIFCTFQARADMVMDVIPVDMVVSTILAAAWKAELEPERLHVLHCTSGTANPLTWGRYADGIIKAAREHPCHSVAWYPRTTLRESRLRTELVMFIFQMIPAIFIHLFAKLAKPEHSLIDIQRRYAKGGKYTSYFSVREWQFSRKTSDELAAMLMEEERDRHPMDPRLLDWDKYLEGCVIGTRTYFHKEPAKTTDRARRQMARLRVIAALSPVLSFTGLCGCFALLMGIHWAIAVPLAAFIVMLLVWL
ncbi:hypothetical protein TSAR_010595 [Trichomalopsis sarcophagae]|uniref:Fatty acyl-CoA reductase n=1 Tax=Trichomalopsis sarcophagae TaxID=543379 RepID=A0A232EHY3_9HYME|nr:hypothetical protein TSAR_010595 [Trichomalopsis sarcophagae]